MESVAVSVFLGACLSLLGRVSLGAGRHDEALKRLDEAKANFLHVGADEEVPAVDARIAECRVNMGDADVALRWWTDCSSRAGSSIGVARMAALLKRVRAHALLQRGDLSGARQDLDASLATAKARNDLLEIALTLLSLIEIHRIEGVEPPPELVTESTSLLDSLKIRVVPEVPVTAPVNIRS